AGHGVGGERDNRDGLRQGRGLEPTGGLPAIEDGETHVHKDDVRGLGGGHINPLPSLDGDEGLIAFALEIAPQALPTILVVLYEKPRGPWRENGSCREVGRPIVADLLPCASPAIDAA